MKGFVCGDAYRLKSIAVGIGGGINQATGEKVGGVVIEVKAEDNTRFFYPFNSTDKARQFAKALKAAADDFDVWSAKDEQDRH